MKTKIIFTSFALLLFFTVNAGSGPLKSKNPKVPGKSSKAAALAALTKNLEYGSDKAAIRSNYYSNLDKLAETIKQDDYAVSLRGHADSIGRYKYNWVLSDNRAISVKKYLVSKGVKEDRIVTTPFGSTIPIASNKTEAGRQKNRRVEIELKKINK
ncbi:OmpA family protein [Pedobacter sp. L105]|uniref:OmpA family protein n=1 Tax=Pedobacter sp. L105 TaxID=1641871 RepID=UPI00131BE380|nr:OmpA family protein [Pedobacter sp. L105]